MKHHTPVLVLALAAAFIARADAQIPSVSGVSVKQDAASRAVTVNYTLSDASAIITLDVLTNGVSIGQQNIWALEGDVNKVVQPGSRTITWHPEKSWPNQKFGAGVVTAKVVAWNKDDPPQYLAADLVSGDVNYYTCAEAVPGGVQDVLYKTTSILMRRINAKGMTAVFGSPDGEPGRWNESREGLLELTFENDYYIGVYEVTQQQWYETQGKWWPSYFSNESYRQTRPVDSITYAAIRTGGDNNTSNDYPGDPADGTFLGNLRRKTGLAFDLPGQWQWEYACRAYNVAMAWGDGSSYADSAMNSNSDIGNEDANRLGRNAYNHSGNDYNGSVSPTFDADVDASKGTAIVGSYEPNSWGLYDMHGNVWEFVLDIFQEGRDTDAVISGYDGVAKINCRYGAALFSDAQVTKNHSIRGGCWNRGPWRMRPAFYAQSSSTYTADNKAHTYGFRLAITLP